MFIQSNKLKRDYKITWTELCEEDDINNNIEYTKIIKDCRNQFEAYELWYADLEYEYDELDIDAVELSHQDYVNAEVYELVLADLFEGKIGVYEYVDLTEEDLLITEEPEGLQKLLVEHQAQLKYNTLKGQ